MKRKKRRGHRCVQLALCRLCRAGSLHRGRRGSSRSRGPSRSFWNTWAVSLAPSWPNSSQQGRGRRASSVVPIGHENCRPARTCHATLARSVHRPPRRRRPPRARDLHSISRVPVFMDASLETLVLMC